MSPCISKILIEIVSTPARHFMMAYIEMLWGLKRLLVTEIFKSKTCTLSNMVSAHQKLTSLGPSSIASIVMACCGNIAHFLQLDHENATQHYLKMKQHTDTTTNTSSNSSNNNPPTEHPFLSTFIPRPKKKRLSGLIPLDDYFIQKGDFAAAQVAINITMAYLTHQYADIKQDDQERLHLSTRSTHFCNYQQPKSKVFILESSSDDENSDASGDDSDGDHKYTAIKRKR